MLIWKDHGYSFGWENPRQEWNQLMEGLEGICPASAHIWQTKPDSRLAVIQHLIVAHGMTGEGADDFIEMADRLHMWRQLATHERDVGVIYKA